MQERKRQEMQRVGDDPDRPEEVSMATRGAKKGAKRRGAKPRRAAKASPAAKTRPAAKAAAKPAGEANGDAKLLTLTEVAKRTGISMPTLQKYKKQHADRIPSQGKGRGQRYPEASLSVFSSLRDENMKRRGRPRKS